MIFDKTAVLQLGQNAPGGTPEQFDARTRIGPEMVRAIEIPEQLTNTQSGGFPLTTPTSFCVTFFVDTGASVGATNTPLVNISPGLWELEAHLALISNVPTLASIGNPIFSLMLGDPAANFIPFMSVYHQASVPTVTDRDALLHLRRVPLATAAWQLRADVASTGVGQFLEARLSILGNRIM